MQVVKRFWILVTFLMSDTNVFKQPEANMVYLRQLPSLHLKRRVVNSRKRSLHELIAFARLCNSSCNVLQ